MFCDGPLAAAADHVSFGQKVAAFLDQAKQASTAGITWSEFGQLLLALLRLTMSVLDRVPTLTGAEKKALVQEAVAALFDGLADYAVPVAAWPVWLLARPAIRSLVLALSSGAIEVLLPLLRSVA